MGSLSCLGWMKIKLQLNVIHERFKTQGHEDTHTHSLTCTPNFLCLVSEKMFNPVTVFCQQVSEKLFNAPQRRF